MTLLTTSFNYLKLHENVAQLYSKNKNVRIYGRFMIAWADAEAELYRVLKAYAKYPISQLH